MRLMTLTIEQGGEQATLPGFELEVISGPDRGAKLELKSERTVVGTHPSNDLVLTDETVSRFHCELELAGNRVLVRDLESRNGTRLNEISILSAHIDGPAMLTLGKTRIRLEPALAPVKIPLAKRERFGALAGSSATMRALFAILDRAAKSTATVLLEGETGTGKDLAAESIHSESLRHDGPLVVVDCGAVPPELMESTLFGHEKGAFTGATEPRAGAFEDASGGTLFLDEIGELSPEVQPKLLRALESRKIQRLGSTRQHKVDVRVVAATNRNLAVEVNAQRFRPDLYFRLAVVVVRMPALRDRLEDLPLLVDEILRSMDVPPHDPRAVRLRSEEESDALARHAWPGNVRELRNYIERVITLDVDIELAAVPSKDTALPQIDARVPLRVARERWTQYFERAYLESLLADHGDNVTVAAKHARVDRVHLHRLLARAGLR
jgi:transcriptional regulator with PAS, ATPase and Fis domain